MSVLQVEPIVLESALHFPEVSYFLNRNGHYVVVDAERHRLVFLSATELDKVRETGRIGQGPGEFFGIGGLVVDSQNHVYTVDNALKRVQYFTWEGRHLDQFLVAPRPFGFAVNSKGEILLGQPQNGKLVTVYSRDGKLLRQFGDLRKISDFYGSKLSELDAKYKYAINRIHLAVDEKGNVYVAFVGAPYLQKYGPDGSLIFSKQVQGEHADHVLREFQSRQRAPMRRGLGDTVATPGISHGLAVDDASGLVFISMMWFRSWIHVADSHGEGLASLVWDDEKIAIQNISLSEDGKALLGARLSVVHHDEMYKVEIPTTILKP